jgi:CRISPR-associated protein Csb2
MAMAIAGEFITGVYLGHVGAGQADPLPSAARLHSALMAAAASGTRAEAGPDSRLRPNAADAEALHWLEEHPPDGLVLPARGRSESHAIAYRNLGLLNPKLRGVKKAAKSAAPGTSVAGAVCWVWEVDPPGPVLESLDALCADVPYLGQADSPVRLHVQTAALPRLTHRRLADARLGARRSGDADFAVPRPGRTAVLEAVHRRTAGGLSPTPQVDRAKTDEKELPSAEATERVGLERFRPVRPVEPDGPWKWCWKVPIEGRREISRERSVAYCVALRRAIISQFDGDAPPLLTGRYADGAAVPPNRLAVQLLSDSPYLSQRPSTRQVFVVAVPTGADPADIAVIGDALDRVRRVHAQGSEVVVPAKWDPSELVDASAFWALPQAGLRRLWSVLPAVVETRAQGKGWTLADAVFLSIGLVWRESLGDDEWNSARGAVLYRTAVAAARRAGVQVIRARQLPTSRVGQFLHKIPEGLLPLPYEATVDLGELVPQGTAFAAIGQSRHLGGGLLVPCDVPADVAESWRLG